MTTTTNCPGCGAVIHLDQIDGKSGRLQGKCKCNGGRAVLEVSAPQVNKRKKKEKRGDEAKDILGGSDRADDSGGSVPEVS